MKKSISFFSLLLISGLSAQPTLADCKSDNAKNSDFPESLVTTEMYQHTQSAWYDDATKRYAHGVLGDAIEPSTLMVRDDKGCTHSIILDQEHVFEDLAPRLADIDQDSDPEIITVRSHQNYGAQIAVYKLTEGTLNLLTTTPYIGTSNRWLAPVGIADFNSDGDMDIAFVDRPHLAKTLRVWSYTNGKLQQVANKAGYSNHRIGEAFISGGIKSCDGKTTMITADAYWTRILETTLEGEQLFSRDIGEFNGTDSFNQALQCSA